MYQYIELTSANYNTLFNSLNYIEEVRLKRCGTLLLTNGYGEDFKLTLDESKTGCYLGVPFLVNKYEKGTEMFSYLLDTLKRSKEVITMRKIKN